MRSAVKKSTDDREAMLQKLAACDKRTLAGLVALVELQSRAGDERADYLGYLEPVMRSDVSGLRVAERSYGVSWKQRGGKGAYHMLARKWERIEKRVAERLPARADAPGASAYDIFEHIAADRMSDGLIDDVRDLRRYLLLIEAETRTWRAEEPELPFAPGPNWESRDFLDHLEPLAARDIATIREKQASYGASWKRNGGIGAFMIFARKWDRIKNRVALDIEVRGSAPGAEREDVFQHIAADARAEPVLDDIRDLRCFLLLLEAEMAARGAVTIGDARDNREKG